MKRLRDQQGASDPVVARTARLFAAADASEVSERDLTRVWNALNSRSKSSNSPRLARVAVALAILFGFAAAAYATVGRNWFGQPRSEPRPARFEKTISRTPTTAAPPNILPHEVAPDSPPVSKSPGLPAVPPSAPATPPRPRNRMSMTGAPMKTPLDDEDEAKAAAHRNPILPNEAPILPAR